MIVSILRRPLSHSALPFVKLACRSPSIVRNAQVLKNVGWCRFASQASKDGDIESTLLDPLEQPVRISGSKVAIVGAGQVGVATAFALISQNVCTGLALIDLALIDRDEDKLEGETMDLQHGMSFVPNVRVLSSTDFSAAVDSKVCIITAGVRQKPGEGRLELLQRNVDVFKQIIPQVARHAPDSTLLVVSNPVDSLTHAAWKLSGFPKHRVIGSGTNLDSSRFRFLISQRLHVSPSCCHGWIIGEHGDTCVPIWSGLNLAGVQLADLNPKIGEPDDPEGWERLHQAVVDSAQKVIQMKGFTSWGIALSVAAITRCILRNLSEVLPVSTLAKGYHGIEKEVFLSLPCVLGQNGINFVVKQNLSEKERKKLLKSAETLSKAEEAVQW